MIARLPFPGERRRASWIALVRPVSARIDECELTHRPRVPIDVDRARREHAGYVAALRDAGAVAVELPALDDAPDAVFVEDCAVVLDEIAVVCRPGAASRRVEVPSVAEALRLYRPIHGICAPATIDGGDVLVVGHTLYVGRTRRTNDDGIGQLTRATAPFGYRVIPVDVTHCLHLKSACTQVADDTMLANPAWVDVAVFASHHVAAVADGEDWAANALRVGQHVFLTAGSPGTRAALVDRGIAVREIDISELAKAESGLTCSSIVLRSIS